MPYFNMQAKVRRALDFLHSEKTYAGLGGLSRWPYEPNGEVLIPEPALTDELNDVQVFKKIAVKHLLRIDGLGDIVFQDMRFSQVDEGIAYQTSACHIMFEVNFLGNEAPEGTYRKLGIYEDMTFTVPGYLCYPDQISLESTGYLHSIIHFPPVAHTGSTNDKFKIIIEF